MTLMNNRLDALLKEYRKGFEKESKRWEAAAIEAGYTNPEFSPEFKESWKAVLKEAQELSGDSGSTTTA